MNHRIGDDDSTTGFDKAPDRYMTDGRETIDRIRDESYHMAGLMCGQLAPFDHILMTADYLFAYHCRASAMAYRDRAGRKGPAAIDIEKAMWYEQMMRHVVDGDCEDPRHNRPGFIAYVPPVGYRDEDRNKEPSVSLVKLEGDDDDGYFNREMPKDRP